MITEVGVMAVKPNLNIMEDATPEGQILSRLYQTVTTASGGPYRVYWGLEIEDPLRLWAFFDFDSVEQHEEFAKNVGEEAVKDLPKILSIGYFTKHVAVTPSPPLVLLSPVTEIMLAYFPSNISTGAKEAASTRFKQFKEKGLDKCDDVKGVSYGWGIENDFPVLGGEEGQKGSLLTAFIGWPSVDAHMRFRETEAFKKNVDLLTGMEGLTHLGMVHISCRSLERKT
ncbi:hypothetical protein H2200_009676 [Cladophialophora chaetospira]|uniref:ABM domain-containing protein n=1 Tax=Cladophialophora chaetospira TaxID=386627 RepID=A0AA39CF38_9EURO|nr:hypothetical protein H2200_009676 [Cladophialophora chaetospira]